jgi:hypothetical protein
VPKKSSSIEIVDTPDGRYIVTTLTNGTVERKLIDQTPKPGPRRFRPFQVSRVKRIDYSKKKRF